ncbi:hypothetical protein RFI_10263 [Reticulomyxa filosa]|uniref:Uncharacterized protein n=1 Tax=Reticulomyxa filosa TaxID=46433 RepID=X6NMH3_RETFI|nr:hypothetical protein RFI_10263 [Reticulomyxa filosa]|eukprot:ETO26869.1 hypothetical protein RFI_10263 [Reticulomyxa filosa]
MGNLYSVIAHSCTKSCIPEYQSKDSTAYSYQLCKWSSDRSFEEGHRQALDEILLIYGLQDLMSLFISLIEDKEIKYYGMIHPGLCNIDENGHIRAIIKICPKWVQERILLQFLGPTEAGKTAFMYKFSYLDIQYYEPNKKPDFVRQIQLNDKAFTVQLVDSYATRFDSVLLDSQIRYADCIFIAFNVCEEHLTEETITKYLDKIASRYSNGSSLMKPTIIVGTKTDLRKDFSKYKHNLDMAIQICQKFDIPYIEVSLKNNVSVYFLIQYAIYHIWFTQCCKEQ